MFHTSDESSLSLAERYQKALEADHVIANLPLTTLDTAYSDMTYNTGINNYVDNTDILYAEARKIYPSIGTYGVGIMRYYTLNYSKPALVDYNTDDNQIGLIFPVYQKDEFISCRMPVDQVKKMIESEIVLNLHHLSTFQEKPDYSWDGLRKDLAEDIRTANEKMRDTFEVITGLTVNDPLRKLQHALFDSEHQNTDPKDMRNLLLKLHKENSTSKEFKTQPGLLHRNRFENN